MKQEKSPLTFLRSGGTGEAYFRKAFIVNSDNDRTSELLFGQPFKVYAELDLLTNFNDCSMCFVIQNNVGDPVLYIKDNALGFQNIKPLKKGITKVEIEINTKLMPGNYSLSAGFIKTKTGSSVDWVENIFAFKVSKFGYNGQEDYPYYVIHGVVAPESNWKYNSQ